LRPSGRLRPLRAHSAEIDTRATRENPSGSVAGAVGTGGDLHLPGDLMLGVVTVSATTEVREHDTTPSTTRPPWQSKPARFSLSSVTRIGAPGAA